MYIYIIGEQGGTAQVTLTIQQTPSHTHPLIASNLTGTSSYPDNAVLAVDPSHVLNLYHQEIPDLTMDPRAMSPAGGSQPHTNIGPYISLSFFMCTNENGCSGITIIIII